MLVVVYPKEMHVMQSMDDTRCNIHRSQQHIDLEIKVTNNFTS